MNTASSHSGPELVQDQPGLEQLCTELEGLELLGLDTEFHAENRYEPEFMLLQLAAEDGRSWVIDPKEISLYDLGTVLGGVEVVTHGGQNDVYLLREHLGLIPQSFYDTQIAAAFLGDHYPIRLDSLLVNRLSRTHSKQESLTDWSRRPLSSSQIQYAVDDARSLLELRAVLNEKLVESNYESHFRAACIEMRDLALLSPSELQWMQWGGAEWLAPASQRILTRLMSWRERTAKEKGRPANYILPRSIAYHIARTQPRNKHHLYANRRINRGLIQKHGKELLSCVEHGLSDRQTYRMPTVSEQRMATLLMAFAGVISNETGIHQTLLMSNQLAVSIAMYGAKRCIGWRFEVYGERLIRFLAGDLTISISNSKMHLKN